MVVPPIARMPLSHGRLDAEAVGPAAKAATVAASSARIRSGLRDSIHNLPKTQPASAGVVHRAFDPLLRADSICVQRYPVNGAIVPRSPARAFSEPELEDRWLRDRDSNPEPCS